MRKNRALLLLFWTLAQLGCSPQEEVDSAIVLVEGPVIEQNLAGGGSDTYWLNLEAGQFAQVTVEQKGIDVVLELYSPGGDLLITVDSPNGKNGPEVVSEVAETPGDYSLRVVSHNSRSEPGRYEVELSALGTATARGRARVRAERARAEAKSLAKQRDEASLAKALVAYERAITSWSETGDGFERASDLHRLGRVHATRGAWTEAGSAYSESLGLFTRLGELRWRALLENRLGWAEARLGRPESAVIRYRTAENLGRALGDSEIVGAALSNLGVALGELGELQRASEAYGRALEIFRDLGMVRREADLRLNRGVLMLQLDRLDLAREDFDSALATYRRFEDSRKMAIVLKWLGDVATQDGRLDDAQSLVGESLAIRQSAGIPRAQAAALHSLGSVHRKLGGRALARSAFEQALELLQRGGRSTAELDIQLDLARLEAESGDFKKAHGLYRHALVRSLEVGDLRGEAASRKGLARVLRAQGDLQRALEEISRAVEVIETLRTQPAAGSHRRSYRAFRQEYFELELELLVRLAEASPSHALEVQAFEVAERGRARGLLDESNESGRSAGRAEDLQTLQQRNTLRQRLEKLVSLSTFIREELGEEPPINRLLLELEGLETKSANPMASGGLTGRPLGLVEIQERVLEADTLLLVYALGEERSFLWSVSKASIDRYSLPEASRIEQWVGTAYSAVSRMGQDGQRIRSRAARHLSEVLLAPVAPRLARHRLLIVPDGALNRLPFAMLPDPRWDDATPAPGREPRLLIESHEIVYLPSISAVDSLRQRPRGRRPGGNFLTVLADPVLELGDPRIGESETIQSDNAILQGGADLARSAASLGLDGFTRLPYSGEEAQAILELAEGLSPQPATQGLLGLEATRRKVLEGALADSRILHFATHGLLDARLSDLSGLVLSLVDSEGQPQPGFLRAYEIAGLELSADLVVLSACQTGMGQIQRGEGVMGLGHRFMNAGVPRLVVSLWNVGDQSTAELMKRFYRQLLVEGRTPPAALRQAQLSMLGEERWSRPRYWAGFVFRGDWQALDLMRSEKESLE